MANQKPVAEVRTGRVKAAIWRNETEGRTRHKVTFSRLYKDGEQWKPTRHRACQNPRNASRTTPWAAALPRTSALAPAGTGTLPIPRGTPSGSASPSWVPFAPRRLCVRGIPPQSGGRCEARSCSRTLRRRGTSSGSQRPFETCSTQTPDNPRVQAGSLQELRRRTDSGPFRRGGSYDHRAVDRRPPGLAGGSGILRRGRKVRGEHRRDGSPHGEGH